MMGFNVIPLYFIAHNEFKRILGHPLVIIIACILIMIAVLNGIGSSQLIGFEKVMEGDDVLIKVGMSQIFWNLSKYCTIAAMFIGLVSIAGDRSNGSLNVLLSKPLYRKDVIAGKFFGIAVFMLFLVSMTLLISSLLIMLFFRAPSLPLDFLLRLSTLIFLLFLECSLTVGLTMLIGIVFKNLLGAAVITASFLYLEWYTTIPYSLSFFNFIVPSSLYIKIFSSAPEPRYTGLLDTSLEFLDWANLAAPYILLIVLYTIAVLFINSYMFTKSEDY